MTQLDEHVAILRCQTWNVWPEKTFAEEPRFEVEYGAAHPLPARLAILSYQPRSSPERYVQEETSVGPLLWDGETPGLHRIRDTVLKAPDDVVEVAWQHRNAHRGEVDICINFKFAGEVPSLLIEALRASVHAVLSLINLYLEDYLTPATPFQLRKVLPNGGGQMESTLLLSVHNRRMLSQQTLESTLQAVTSTLLRSSFGPKLRVALELYAAHFTEQQARVRFLLLVTAIESLASATPKHKVATDMLLRWKDELEAEIRKHEAGSEALLSLEALHRELGFRAEDSIRS